jgi:hypothetical protein
MRPLPCHHVSLSYLIYFLSESLDNTCWWTGWWFWMICVYFVVAIFWLLAKRAVIVSKRFENGNDVALALCLWWIVCKVVKGLQWLKGHLKMLVFNLVLRTGQINERTFQVTSFTTFSANIFVTRKLFQDLQSPSRPLEHFIRIRNNDNELSSPQALI